MNTDAIGNASMQEVGITRVGPGDLIVNCLDVLAVEEPLEISLTWIQDNKITSQTISVTMRTPGYDDLLAAGFLFTEGIIKDFQSIAEIKPQKFTGNNINVRLENNVVPQLNNTERNFYTTSSCGVCGKSSIEAIHTVSTYEKPGLNEKIDAAILCRLPQQLREQQEAFNRTGGLHAAALFSSHGEFINMQEDVGRHNALDKLIGWALLQGLLPLAGSILLLSGRASFELIQKATMAGISIVAAIGAPSSLAVQLATESNITLAGFVKEKGFNIYCHAERIYQSEK
ncbi:MAG: formate dehydrogenase accessory sulfurtransferase FdhD [Ferruginibacter sp.]